MLVFLPLHLFGLCANYFPYKIPVLFVKTKSKRHTFSQLIKNEYRYNFFTFYIGILVCLISVFIGTFWGIASACFPSNFALYNFRYWIYYLKLKGAWKYYLKAKKDDF